MAANIVMGALKSHLNDKAIDIEKLNLSPVRILEMIQLIKIKFLALKLPKNSFFDDKATDVSALKLAEENELIQESDPMHYWNLLTSNFKIPRQSQSL